MITFQLDDKNDLTLGKSASIEMLSGIKAVAQTAENYAKTLLGEMIHAIDEGVPYFGTVFARGDTVQFEAALRRRLQSVPEVRAVRSLTVLQVGEIVSYNASIDTIYGITTING